MYQGMACSATAVTLWPVPTCISGLPASQHPQESPGPLGSAHNTLSVWTNPLGTFPLTGYDQQFGSCNLCRPTANIRDNKRGNSLKVGTYLNQCLQLSVQLCPREKTQMSLKLQFGMCSDELLADQLPTQFQWVVRISGSAQYMQHLGEQICNLEWASLLTVELQTPRQDTGGWAEPTVHTWTSKFLITKFLFNIYRLLIKIDTNWTTLCSSFHHYSMEMVKPGHPALETCWLVSNALPLFSWPLVLGGMITVKIEVDMVAGNRGGHGSWQSHQSRSQIISH